MPLNKLKPRILHRNLILQPPLQHPNLLHKHHQHLPHPLPHLHIPQKHHYHTPHSPFPTILKTLHPTQRQRLPYFPKKATFPSRVPPVPHENSAAEEFAYF